ncbi:protein AAR2 homolog [Bactrocera oleae]|uniref:protein AAR2 homolog n=1 Tax=Bactrocera oleae TaxID=104688 RepID=UPI0006B7C197|nr:protein AAR2 homolog isoform X1 [Bactrocera oleae]
MNVDVSAMEMDPEMAKKLFASGAVLVITGAPVGTEFGIDLCNYTIGEKFRGVKMIPPGPHYIWCASCGPYGDVAPRVGFVHYFKSEEVVVREWSQRDEEMQESQADDKELEKKRIRDNLKEFDSFLAPYDYRFYNKWKLLTDKVTESTVERCRPTLGPIRTNVELQSCSDEDRPRGTLHTNNLQQQSTKTIVNESDLLPNLKPVEGTAPRFTELPTRVPQNASPAEVSRHSIDCVCAIETLVGKFHSSEALIEEEQLAFVFYLVGCSVESLSYWRNILHLLGHSEQAVQNFKILYMKYAEALMQQLPHLPEELMEPGEYNSVYKDVRSLLVNLNMGGLGVSADKLSRKLQKTLQWHFEGLLDEDPEDMPVIVELT